MFWGLKLEKGKNYSQALDFSFHISHATLGPPESGSAFTAGLVKVHAVVEDTDYILCYLGKIPNSEVPVLQQPLDLEISYGEKVTLYMDCVSSSKDSLDTVYLTGYISGTYGTAESDYGDSKEQMLDSSPLPTSDEDEVAAVPASKKRKREHSQPTATAESTQLKKRKKKKKDVSLKEDTPMKGGKKAAKDAEEKPKATGTVFKTNGGTEVQDIVEGSGKYAKAGRKVFVRYTGRLAHNNRIFDSNITSNRHFMFCLGRGEVVKGWDEGIKGMRVGGKRKLSIPPSQGYGPKGAPPKIPPNSRLLFDIELTAVK